MISKNFYFAFLCLSLALLLSCNGGSSGSQPSTSISIPATLAFGQVGIGTLSATRSVTLTNTGTTAVSFSSAPTITGTNAQDFSLASSTCGPPTSLQPNQSCVVNLTFTPSRLSAESASLSFFVTDATNPLVVALSGTGIAIVNNQLPGQVTLSGNSNVNAFYVSITICAPGTATCQTISNVEIDTGSVGLRLPASVLSISLPNSQNNLGHSIANCVQFADMSYGFGPVKLADVKLSGESASNIPIQIMHDTSFASTPSSCAITGGSEITSPSTLGGNGLLGLGLFKEDCGPACAAGAIAGTYYSCTSGSCTSSAMPLAQQIQNPVTHFSADNNGISLTLPAIGSQGAQTVNGTLTFGIGTQVNNALGTATILTTDAIGNLSTTYNNHNYPSFIDSGSNGLFFLSTAETGLSNCSIYQGFYCPATAQNFSTTLHGQNGNSAAADFSIQNAQTLFTSHSNYAAYNNLGGPFPGYFDFGMSYFFGKTIFFGIEGQSVGTTTGPLVAY